MLITSTKKILIVPDFGVSAEAEAMVALKAAIEARPGGYSAMIADLQKMVLDQSPGKELKDSQVIELAARRLEALALDKTLVWDHHEDDAPDPLHDYDWSGLSSDEKEISEPPAEEGSSLKAAFERALRPSMKITSSRFDLDPCEPDIIVVFGKSVMLAGGVKDKEILLINPEYDSEWPWRKQYYADRDAAEEFMGHFYEEVSKPTDSYLHDGVEVNRRPEPTVRFALMTTRDGLGTFGDRYPNLGEVDESLGTDTERIATEICRFADHKMEFQMLEIQELLHTFDEPNWQCTFAEPVRLDYVTVLGLSRGIPYANGQSGIKVRTKEDSYPLPIEAFRTRADLALLKDAVSKAIAALPPRKRILIVSDYFTSYRAQLYTELRDSLRRWGYYVSVTAGGDTLERTRTGIERRCKKKPFDLIVTIETGCLLAARIINTPRIFVNPDWTAWERLRERMKQRDAERRFETRDKDNYSYFFTYYLNGAEIAEARNMSQRYYIRKDGKPTVGWFTSDMMDTNLPEEHMKRFNSACYPPVMNLGDADSLASEIHKYFQNIIS